MRAICACVAVAALAGMAVAEEVELVPVKIQYPKSLFGDNGPKLLKDIRESKTEPKEEQYPKVSLLKIGLPKPAQWPGSPGDLTDVVKNLDPHPYNAPRPPIIVPQGCGQLLSGGCKVTSSDLFPCVGDLPFVTDGRKEEASDENVRLVLNDGLQWVQIDLGEQKEIYAVCLWHSFSPRVRVYHDVVVQVSGDPDFMEEVVTIFNNDHDNSAKLGAGKDFEYVETHEGRPIAVEGVKGRYVRCYSNGNIRDKSNTYVQVEVFGRK